MSPVDVSTSLAGLEHRDIPLFPIVSGWECVEKRLARLLSCAGMSKLLEWFLLFLATMPSSHAEDRRLAEDGGEMRMYFPKERRPFKEAAPYGGRSPLTLLLRRYGRSR